MKKRELTIFNTPVMKAYLAERQKKLAALRKTLDEMAELAAIRESR